VPFILYYYTLAEDHNFFTFHLYLMPNRESVGISAQHLSNVRNIKTMIYYMVKTVKMYAKT